MIAILSLSLALNVALPAVAAPHALLQATNQEHDQKLKDAGNDVQKLLDLAKAWADARDDEGARAAYGKVLTIDKDNAVAHKGLRHHFYDGRWFDTYSAMFDARKADEDKMAAKGLVRLGEEWVPKADMPFLKMKWTKGSDGAWVNPAVTARLAREKELTDKGQQQQDLTWIQPEEFEQWKQGLWKCGDKWLGKAEADAYHSEIATWWQAPCEHFVVYSTCDRETVEWIKWYADHTYEDLVRIFGVEPGSRPSALDLLGPQRNKPSIAILRTLAQHNDLATGNPGAQRPPVEVEGFSSLHYAYFAEAWFDLSSGVPTYRGSGVGFWDRTDANLAPYGQHAIRHAAGQSFVEAIDPSFEALANVGTAALAPATFWAEKKIPRWLRYGAASYVERYFIDKTVGDKGNPLWAREWGFANLKAKAALQSLDPVFKFAITLDDIPNSTLRINEAGCVVAYMLDGNDDAVKRAHQAFQEALRKNTGTREAATALEDALRKSEPAIRKFAGL